MSQDSYQVRFDWGHAGAAAAGQDADVVVWVSQLAGVAGPDHVDGAPVLRGSLEQAAELASWSLARQTELGGRLRVAVIAAGVERPDGTLRFAVEDLLAAGAIIEAISDAGIDHQSPEAAAAASAYRGLRGAMRHLMSASETARESRS